MFPGMPFLNDKGIVECIERGLIKVDLYENQIQPATLDIRVGRVELYDKESMGQTILEYNSRKSRDADLGPTDEFAKIFPESEAPIRIPSQSYLELFIGDDFWYDKPQLFPFADLRSSRGRLHLDIQQHIVHGEHGPFISLRNENPNDIVLYGKTPFAQLFFSPLRGAIKSNGYVVARPDEARSIANTLSDDLETSGPVVVFRLGEKALRFKKIGVIDTRHKYKDDELYETLDTSLGLIQSPVEPLIFSLEPRLKMPADVGIPLLWNYYAMPLRTKGFVPSASIFDSIQSCAGWIDPGYEGFVTAHPRRLLTSKSYHRGDIAAFGFLIRYTDPCGRVYGNCGNHYQGSNGAGFRS